MSGFDLTQTAGAGMDNIETSESMPLIKILQDLSAEVKTSATDHEEKRIEGNVAGDIVFLGDRTILEKPVKIIPVAQETVWVEWIPKDSGGGIAGQHGTEILLHPDYKKGIGADKYKEYLGDNDLKKTIYVSVFFEHNGGHEKGIVAFSGGSLGAVRAWSKVIMNFRYPANMKLDGVIPPIFARRYTLDTFVDQNAAKDTYYNWKIAPADNGILDPKKDEELLTMCYDACQLIKQQIEDTANQRKTLTDDEVDAPF